VSDSTAALLSEIADHAVAGEGLSPEEALWLLELPEEAWLDVLSAADRVRRVHRGNRVRLCSIVNARSGRCSEDCAFCAQSTHHQTAAAEYPLLSADEMFEQAVAAKEAGAGEFSIVTSGRGAGGEADFERILLAVRRIAELGLEPCASLGLLKREQLVALREAGLQRYHHNLEAPASHFGAICTTHTFGDNVAAVRAAGEAGLRVCCGGIFGMGESDAQRVEMVLAIRELDGASVPVNFLNPIPGTPLADRPLVPARHALRIIALVRLAMPAKDIIVCGGREVTLGDLQSLVFAAGANGLLLGHYLTTAGRAAAADLKMIADLGLEPEPVGSA